MASWGDIGIGAGKGALAGASTGAMIGSAWPGLGTLIGGIIGGIVGLFAGGVEGNYEGNERDGMVANQQKAADIQNEANETAARRNAAAMYKQAAADPKATSATMFRKAELQRDANTNYADIRDRGNPFHAANDKASKQFYGKTNVAANKAA
jgi:phage tail tape-measure protein